MDPVTHGLTGVAISNLGFRRKAVIWVCLLASIAPDFDYVSRFWGADIFLRYHRGITHGILALFLVPLIIGLIFGRKKDFVYYSLVAFLCYAAHLLLDLTNQYGTRILSPLDWNQYSLDLMFIIDPYITFGLLLSFLLCRMNRRLSVTIAAITLCLIIAYAGGRYYLHGKTMDFVKQRVDANSYKICPLPNDFLRWWFITRSGDKITVGFADLFTKRICTQETYELINTDKHIEQSMETRVVRNFLHFAKYPYSEIRKEAERTIVTWRDLAYSFSTDEHFVAKVVFDKDDKVVKAYFRF
jgi:inner membrane protein